jgi:Rod binding domain-containing protein
MTPPLAGAAGPGPAVAGAAREPHAALRRLAHELEGVFLAQLFAAMRASVPDGGLVNGSAGEDLFRSMLDERLAAVAADRFPRGIGEALYRQLSRGLPPAGPEDPEPTP